MRLSAEAQKEAELLTTEINRLNKLRRKKTKELQEINDALADKLEERHRILHPPIPKPNRV